MLVGRTESVKKMKQLLKTDRSEFLAITGRRRVGKTYLIDQVYAHHICFRMTGIQDGTLDQQLLNFQVKLSEHTKEVIPVKPNNWQEAFLLLKNHISKLSKKRKHVIFIDELPWIVTPKSGFLEILAHFWNDYLSKEKNFVLVVCGSSTSWITEKIINATGGLHNRLTETIKLSPFNIRETRQFLKQKGVSLTNVELTKLYMALGGVPYYLEKIEKGESATTAIERICFSNEGSLRNEYDNLYKALFKNPEYHEALIRILSKFPDGLTAAEIGAKTNIPPGGTFKRTKDDLLLSGFIEEYIPYGKIKRDAIYKLVDEFSIFYNKFVKSAGKYKKGMWQQMTTMQKYKIWLGYAFEIFCSKHVDQIKEALGIAAVYTEESAMRIRNEGDKKGFQIDLLIDRADNTINLCEMKFYDAVFTVDKKYSDHLRNRKSLFQEFTNTKKQIFTTLITTYGIKENQYALEQVDAEVTLDQLIDG